MGNFSGYANQFITVFIACLSVLSVGCAVGWTTPILKKLKLPNSEIPITASQSSWLAGAHEIGHIISPVPAGLLLQIWGRKPTLYLSSVLTLIGWIIVLSTRSVVTLYIVRCLFGLSMGIVFTTVPLYIAEVSHPHIRGGLSTFFQLMLNIGHLIEFSCGPYVSYQNLGIISLVLSLLFVFLGFWMVESPQYLVTFNKRKTKEVLSWLMNTSDNDEIEKEFEVVESMSKDKKKNVAKFTELFSKIYRNKLAILMLVAVAQRFTGMSAIVAYAATTFSNTKGGLTSDQYTIIFGAIGVIFTLIPTALLDSLGRRPLTLLSCGGCAVFHLITGIYFYLAPKNLTWIPFLTISIFSILYSLGIGPLVNTLQGELFPPHLKGLASSITTISHGISSFIVTKLFQIIRDSCGIYWNFFIFAIFCLISCIFSYFMVPETKRKPLQELLNGSTRSSSNNLID